MSNENFERLRAKNDITTDNELKKMIFCKGKTVEQIRQLNWNTTLTF